MDPAEQNDAGPQPAFVACMGGWGNCIAACFNCLFTCCATSTANLCSLSLKIRQLVVCFYRKLFINDLVGARIVCFFFSISLWIGGTIAALNHHHKRCIKHPTLSPCREISRYFLMVVMLVPLIVVVTMFLVLLYKLCRTKSNEIHGGGPVLLPMGHCWTASISAIWLLISFFAAWLSPRSIGAAFILTVTFVIGSTLFEIAIALSPNSGLVMISTSVSGTFSVIVASDSTVEDNYVAYGFIYFDVCMLVLSYSLHGLIKNSLQSLSEQREAESLPDLEDVLEEPLSNPDPPAEPVSTIATAPAGSEVNLSDSAMSMSHEHLENVLEDLEEPLPNPAPPAEPVLTIVTDRAGPDVNLSDSAMSTSHEHELETDPSCPG